MGSALELLQSAENFVSRLSWSSSGISSQFTLEMCTAANYCEEFTKTPFLGLKVIDVDKAKKPVTSACYDKQHICTYLQPFSHYTSQ